MVLLLFLTFAVTAGTFSLAAQEGEAEEAAEEEPAVDIGPGPLGTLLFPSEKASWKILLKLLPMLLKLLPVILIAAALKVWLLKRKFSIPMKLKPMEKLSVATLSETAVSLYLLLVLIVFFTPAVTSLAADVGLAPAATAWGTFVKLFLHTLFVLPYICVVGAVLILLLISLTTSVNRDGLRGHFKFSAILALITPAVLVVFLLITRIVFKWNYI